MNFKTMATDNDKASSGSILINMLFDAVSNLIKPESPTDIVSGLRAVSLLSKLVSFDESWSSAIIKHCADSVKDCLDELRGNEASITLRYEILIHQSLEIAHKCIFGASSSVLKALAVLASMGGASRPKIFMMVVLPGLTTAQLWL